MHAPGAVHVPQRLELDRFAPASSSHRTKNAASALLKSHTTPAGGGFEQRATKKRKIEMARIDSVKRD